MLRAMRIFAPPGRRTVVRHPGWDWGGGVGVGSNATNVAEALERIPAERSTTSSVLCRAKATIEHVTRVHAGHANAYRTP